MSDLYPGTFSFGKVPCLVAMMQCVVKRRFLRLRLISLVSLCSLNNATAATTHQWTPLPAAKLKSFEISPNAVSVGDMGILWRENIYPDTAEKELVFTLYSTKGQTPEPIRFRLHDKIVDWTFVGLADGRICLASLEAAQEDTRELKLFHLHAGGANPIATTAEGELATIPFPAERIVAVRGKSGGEIYVLGPDKAVRVRWRPNSRKPRQVEARLTEVPWPVTPAMTLEDVSEKSPHITVWSGSTGTRPVPRVAQLVKGKWVPLSREADRFVRPSERGTDIVDLRTDRRRLESLILTRSSRIGSGVKLTVVGYSPYAAEKKENSCRHIPMFGKDFTVMEIKGLAWSWSTPGLRFLVADVVLSVRGKPARFLTLSTYIPGSEEVATVQKLTEIPLDAADTSPRILLASYVPTIVWTQNGQLRGVRGRPNPVMIGKIPPEPNPTTLRLAIHVVIPNSKAEEAFRANSPEALEYGQALLKGVDLERSPASSVYEISRRRATCSHHRKSALCNEPSGSTARKRREGKLRKKIMLSDRLG